MLQADDNVKEIDAARCCVFTIVSRNYFHFALNLMASVAVNIPSARRVIVVCDDLDGLDAGASGVEILSIAELPIPHLDRVALHYTILELNTAVKPFAFARLFESSPDAVVYFDPDIQLYGSGADLLDRLAVSDIVLTPHLTAPLDDEQHPSDLSILQSGTYNLGFLALRRSESADRLLKWWCAKLLRDCVVDIPRGLFTDQKWMDLAPGFFEEISIVRHPGWNVAYWNLAHRDVQRTDSGYEVNGMPLFFFHFSGRDPSSRSISKHQDRFTYDRCSPAVRQLFDDYEAALSAHGREHYSRSAYAFASLADGTPLPDCARAVLRRELEWDARLPDLRSLAGAEAVVAFLNEPVDGRSPPVSRLAMQLHRMRADLQAAFPDVLGAHRSAYLSWFADRAPHEAGIHGSLLRPIATTPPDLDSSSNSVPETSSAAPRTVTDPVDAVAPTTLAESSPWRWPYKMAYRVAWQARHLARPIVPLHLRQRVRSALIDRAYPSIPAGGEASGPVRSSPQEALPRGISLVGYVNAESGVGESARATLRALATTTLPHALVDFRVGNSSRMGEQVDERLTNGHRHSITLFHVNADQLPVARAHLNPAWFAAPHRIGYWAWELENFPAQWHEAFSHVDEVWVPSSFCQRAVAAASPVPVLCMPHAIDVPARLSPDRARFGLRQDSVVFLAMADMMSIAERKNPLGAVKAFIAAFPPNDTRAELLVKVSNPARDAAAFQELRDLVATHPGVHLFPDYLDRGTLNILFDSIDAFVSLHRSEGFGLSIAEAMARGKVALATGWSGNMDFMSSSNSLPVDYDLVELRQDYGPYARGERWAEPSMADAVDKLRLVCADHGMRERLGRRARMDCLANLAPGVIGKRIHSRVDAICKRKLQ